MPAPARRDPRPAVAASRPRPARRRGWRWGLPSHRPTNPVLRGAHRRGCKRVPVRRADAARNAVHRGPDAAKRAPVPVRDAARAGRSADRGAPARARRAPEPRARRACDAAAATPTGPRHRQSRSGRPDAPLPSDAVRARRAGARASVGSVSSRWMPRLCRAAMTSTSACLARQGISTGVPPRG